MTLLVVKITLRAIQREASGDFIAEVLRNSEGDYHHVSRVLIHEPSSPEEKHHTRWYIEKYSELNPLETVKAGSVSASLDEYGRLLSEQVLNAELLSSLRNPSHPLLLHLSIEAPPGLLEFFSIYWEILENSSVWPDQVRSDLHMLGVFRQLPILTNSLVPTFLVQQTLKPFNILLVVARPGFIDDVSHRTISRPLVEVIDKVVERNHSVNLQIVRPGSWEALEQALNKRQHGYFDCVHFDVHGDVEENLSGAQM